MKKVIFSLIIFSCIVGFTNPNSITNQRSDETEETTKTEKRKKERQNRKKKRKEAKLKKQNLREATDSLYIHYEAISGKATKNNPGNILENGTIILEIEEINLFRYNITLTENQNDIIANTSLSNSNSLVNIDPLVFNINTEKLDIPVIPVKGESNLLNLLTLERDLKLTESEIKKCSQELIEIDELYSNSWKIINHKNKLDERIKVIDASINNGGPLDSLQKEKDSINHVIHQLNERIIDHNNYKTQKGQLTKTLDDYLAKLRNLKFSIDSLKILTDNNAIKFQDFNNATIAYQQALIDLNQLTEYYHRLVSILYSDQTFANINSQRIIATQDIFNTKDTITRDQVLGFMFQRSTEIDRSYRQLSQAYGAISAIIIPPPTTNKITNEVRNRDLRAIEQANDIYDNISNFHTQLNTSSYHSLFLQIIKIYDAINETNFRLRFQTNIVSDNADHIRYTFKAEPKNNMPSSIETKAISFDYNVNIIGGYKIDFSTGVFWNIGLMDYSYRFESVTDSTTKVVKEKNENLYIPSIGLLFHLYKRSNKNTKFGWNVGFSTNTQNLNYYTGFSFLLGKSERININVGLAGGQVKRVVDLYNTDKVFPLALSDLPNDVPMRNPNPFKLGAYFGISFNLLGNKNKQALNNITVVQ